jgi:hypothetical protein
MPEDRELVGTSAYLPFMWPRRLLRPIARQARHQAIQASGHPIIEGYDPLEGKHQTFAPRLIDAHQGASPIDGRSEDGRTARRQRGSRSRFICSRENKKM